MQRQQLALAEQRLCRCETGSATGASRVRTTIGKCARTDFEIERSGIARRDLVELLGRDRSMTRVKMSSRPVELFGLAEADIAGGSARLSISGTI